MITVNVHSNGTDFRRSLELEAISEVIKQPDALLWVDVSEPTTDDLALIQREFGFHPLAIEDVARSHQRPKVDIYGNVFFIIFYAFADSEQRVGLPPLVQIGIFIGHNYVVTVHSNHVNALEETSTRWNENSEQIGSHSIGLLVYSILDAIVDGYFPVLDHISDRLEDLEESVFEQFDLSNQHEIFRIKRDLLAIRRVIAPERDVMNVLLRRDVAVFDSSVLVYLQDIYDHILRVTDAVDTYRDLLSGTLEFHLAATSNRLNQIMKTLTAASIMLMGMSLITGVYGMNFVHMPELKWTFGYVWALGLMAATGIGLFALLKRIDWF